MLGMGNQPSCCYAVETNKASVVILMLQSAIGDGVMADRKYAVPFDVVDYLQTLGLVIGH